MPLFLGEKEEMMLLFNLKLPPAGNAPDKSKLAIVSHILSNGKLKVTVGNGLTTILIVFEVTEQLGPIVLTKAL